MTAMRRLRTIALAAALLPTAALAQEGSYTVQPLKDAPPSDLAAAIRDQLAPTGLRVLDAKGKPFVDLWLRKAIPASAKPAGPKGTIQFPFLAEGELLGAARYASEGGDYRDQPIEPAAYTLRYGLQPVNGDHLGVSPYRDYALLVPAGIDKDAAALSRSKLEEQSAEAAGTSHPAILMLLAAASGDSGVVQNSEMETWAVVLPLPLAVEGQSEALSQPVKLIVVGAAKE